MSRVDGYTVKGYFLLIAAVVYFALRYEGFDVSRFWRDDDDDRQGPFRPT